MAFLNIHTHLPSSFSILNLFPEDEIPTTYFSIGVHPCFISNYENQLQLVKEKANDANCLAIGEFGLDSFSKTEIALQEKIVRTQIQLANELKKPIIAHVVKKHNEFTQLLKAEKNQAPVIFHGFNQNENILKMILTSENHFISIGKAILEENSNAQKAIKAVPLNRFFLETDDKQISITEIYAKVSDLKAIELGELIQIQEDLFKRIFHAKL